MGCLEATFARVGGDLVAVYDRDGGDLTASFSLVCGVSVGDILLVDAASLRLTTAGGEYLTVTKEE